MRSGRRAASTLAAAAAFAVAGVANGAGDRPPVPPAHPWEFLDATSQIGSAPAHNGFRGANEADLDNDGDLDVIVVQTVTSAGVVGTPAPSRLYMNEDGRFVDRTAQYLPELLVPQVTWWSNAHDFDVPPDGWRDIFVPGGQGARSRLYRNRGRDGQGNFLGFEDVSGRIDGPLATSTHCYHSHKGDFDGDGAMDMLVYQYRPDLGHGQNRLLMNRNGVLMDETVGRLPIRSEPGIFGHAEDLNNDGWIDISQVNLKNGLVPGNYGGVPSIRVLINDGTGRFPTSLEQQMPERINPQSGLGTYSLEHADVNGDGWLDIYVINWGMQGNEARDAVLVNSQNPSQLFPPGNLPYYPEFAVPSRDSDGDHPSARDLNGDGKVDLVVAQFATRPFFLINETSDNVLKLVEKTPPEVPSPVQGFRTKLFDANGDGRADVWLAMRTQNYLIIGPTAEAEPNDTLAGANAITTYPALRTGAVAFPRDERSGGTGRRDWDVFGLPARATAEGARIRLRPATDTDLRLTVVDAAGVVVAVSDMPGSGVAEQVIIPAASSAAFVLVERQAPRGIGTYRLEVAPVTGAKAIPEPLPLSPPTRP